MYRQILTKKEADRVLLTDNPFKDLGDRPYSNRVTDLAEYAVHGYALHTIWEMAFSLFVKGGNDEYKRD